MEVSQQCTALYGPDFGLETRVIRVEKGRESATVLILALSAPDTATNVVTYDFKLRCPIERLATIAEMRPSP